MAHYTPILDPEEESGQRAIRENVAANWLAQLESLIRKCCMMLWHNWGMSLGLLFAPSVFVIILYVRERAPVSFAEWRSEAPPPSP